MHAAPSDTTPPVLDRLVSALARGATVVTPNNRTSAWLRGAYDDLQRARGVTAWPTPQVLPWNAWIRTLWQRLRATDRPPAEQVLTPWQERRIWASVIAGHSRGTLLHAGNAVDLALAAWDTAQEWNAPWGQWGGDDARDEQRTFAAWASAFVKRCADSHWIDGGRTVGVLIDALRARTFTLAEPLVLYGFAELSPRRAQLLDALKAGGTAVEQIVATVRRIDETPAAHVRCIDPDDEYRRCARWCRELLARDAEVRIGVVIPDLARKKPQVERVFAAMLAPHATLEGARRAAVFNISQGEPLASRALVAAALTLLEWTQHRIAHPQLAALLHSPYLAGHDDESAMRALLCRVAIEEPHDRWPLHAFTAVARRDRSGTPRLAAQLERLQLAAVGWRQRRGAHEWRKAWDEGLAAAGWLTEHPLDSVDFQVRGAWHELLDDWMRAETITPPMTVSEALASVREMAETSVFQPETPPAAVQILGFLEAAGLPFDALWVSGLTAERWPPAPLPNPLLPLDWQRRVGAPHASAAHELAYYRELTAQLAGAADQVVFSWPASIDDIPQTPSALLLERSHEAAPDLFDTTQPGLAHVIRHAGRLEVIDDADGIPVDAPIHASAHAGLVEAAAHCPFQAYARQRLDVEPWPESRAGIDAMERGTLVHCMLSEFWNGVHERDALLRLPEAERQARIAAAVDVALARIPQARWMQLGARMRELERARLGALLDEWLELDAGRPPFRVVETETKHVLDLAGLPLRLRIDRVDAIDGERRVVIDYKTGPSPLHSLQGGTRLIAPQLPLYLEALAEPDVVGVAYAKVRRGKCEAQGIGNPDDWEALKPALPDWPTRRAEWQRALAALARQILDGEAAVDPWRHPQSCSRCHRHALCRINERLGFVAGTEEGKTEAAAAANGATAS